MIRDSDLEPSDVEPWHFAEIEEGQRLRGWITNSYAQIEYMLGDMIIRSREFPEYASQPDTLPHDATRRIKRVRQLLAMNGPLSSFSDELSEVLEVFEQKHETRNLLAHGFCTYLMTHEGDTALQFQKWHRHPDRRDARLVRCFRLQDLKNEQESFQVLARKALSLFVRIHGEFGWIE